MAEHIVKRHEERGIVRLTMNNGANALNFKLVEGLREAISELAASGEAPPVLLTSAHATVFSPGWDLKRLGTADRSELAAFLEGFNGLIYDLFTYPGPTAAAINGHAVAGGCLLALACDLRFMVSGRVRVGLAELNLGVPVPEPSVLMLGARLAPWVVDDLIFGGDGLAAEEALERGIISRKTSKESLLKTAERSLRAIAARPRAGFVASKRFRLQAVWQAMNDTAEQDNQAFVDAWFEPAAQERIAATADQLSQ